MAIVSIGDIVVCTQLAYRLYICLTNGRNKASRDMKEMEDVLFGLYSALRLLEREFENILSQSSNRAQRDIEEKKEQLGRMINCCLRVLTELEEATTSYRQATDNFTVSGPHYRVLGVGYSQQLKTQAKMQWQRVLWYLRSDSFAKYRVELQSHTSAINLFLNIMVWSNTARLEDIGRHQAQVLDEIEQRTVELNENMRRLVYGVAASRSRYQNIALPSLNLPTGGSDYAFRPIIYSNQAINAPALPCCSSAPGEQNPQPLDGSIWPIMPRVQHQLNRDVSDMVDRVTEASEDA